VIELASTADDLVKSTRVTQLPQIFLTLILVLKLSGRVWLEVDASSRGPRFRPMFLTTSMVSQMTFRVTEFSTKEAGQLMLQMPHLRLKLVFSLALAALVSGSSA